MRSNPPCTSQSGTHRDGETKGKESWDHTHSSSHHSARAQTRGSSGGAQGSHTTCHAHSRCTHVVVLCEGLGFVLRLGIICKILQALCYKVFVSKNFFWHLLNQIQYNTEGSTTYTILYLYLLYIPLDEYAELNISPPPQPPWPWPCPPSSKLWLGLRPLSPWHLGGNQKPGGVFFGRL